MAKPAIFLDRDGVICENGYISSEGQMKLLPGVAKAIAKMKGLGYFIAIVTNQPVVARGECTEEGVKRINKTMSEELEKQGACIDAVYFCPHHPEQRTDIPQWAQKYRIECECRKPKHGMLLRAAKEHGLDLKRSWMVGDHDRDIGAGKAAGCRTIFIGNEGAASEARPDAVCESLIEAAEAIEYLNSIQAVILVGGKGERLRPLTESLPKPMLPVGGKPVLEWQLQLLKAHGIGKAVIVGHYLIGAIKDYFGDGSRLGMRLVYIDDGETPLGTGGAVKNATGAIEEDFVLLNGDTVTDVNVSGLAAFHKAKGGLVTAVVRETDHPHDSDLVLLDADERAVKFFPKDAKEKEGKTALTGIYMISKSALAKMPQGAFNLDSDFLSKLVAEGHVFCHRSGDYIRDMGTPERYARVQKDFEALESFRKIKELKE
jgi:histidinol-phosphate phosphatase family protein